MRKSHITFETQPSRRYTINHSFFGPPEKMRWYLVLMNRFGSISTASMPMDGIGGITLTRLMVVLMYGPLELIGLDSTVGTDRNTGAVNTLCVNDRKYTVIRHIFSDRRLVGKGTQVWIVQEPGSNDLTEWKDSWVPANRETSEVDILKRINGHPQFKDFACHLPTLVWSAEALDSTAQRRRGLADKPPLRDLVRILTTPVGDPITSFCSKRELITVIKDVVIVLRLLSEKVGVMHADISINNILIHRVREGTSITARGLVIDLGYALLIGASTVSGTPPWMSIETLSCNPGYRHEPRHDLESVVWVLLTLCVYTDGPCHLRDLDTLSDHVTRDKLRMFSQLFYATSHQQLALIKFAIIQKIEGLPALCAILAPYWHDFAPFLCSLIQACWKPSLSRFDVNTANYADFINIFDETLANVVDDETIHYPLKSIPIPPSSKRLREDEDTGHDGRKRRATQGAG